MANLRYLQDLPPELKAMIFWYISDEDPIDITVRLPSYGQGYKVLQRGLPSAIANMHGLLQAGPETRAFATAYIGQQKYSCNSEALADLPLAFGPGHCAHMASVAQDVCEDLPNLTKLEIWSSYEVHKVLSPYPEHESGDPDGTISRQGQEQRAVIKLGCFIASRHESLKRVIKPANSGPTFEVGETKIVNRVIIDSGYTEGEDDDFREPKVAVKWKDVTRQERVTIEDEVSDATKIQRLKHDEWSNIDISGYYKKPALGDAKHKMPHSETPEANDMYKVIDERAYRTEHELNAKRWAGHTLDEWIDICDSAVSISGQNVQELALLNSELQSDLKQGQAELTEKEAELTRKEYELHQNLNDTRKVVDESNEVSMLLRGAEDQAQMYKEQGEMYQEQLEHTQKGMRSLERRLRREREEFAAYRVHIQAAANATTAEIVAGSTSGRGGAAAGRGARREGARASGRGGH